MRGHGREFVRLAGLGLLLVSFGVGVSAQELGTDGERAEGKQLYDKYCAQCHGLGGDGKGYATPRTKPEPRASCKYTATPFGKKSPTWSSSHEKQAQTVKKSL